VKDSGTIRKSGGDGGDAIPPPEGTDLLPRHLCRVIGLNQNFTSRSGTSYHIQIEDRGPVFDDAAESWVRRVNTIVYANYGEPTAHIVHGRDEDLSDVRTHAHNRIVEEKIQQSAAEARTFLETREQRQVARVKALLLKYYKSRDEAAKTEFDEANRLYPLIFARAWKELKDERSRVAAISTPEPEEVDETLYPLDPNQRKLVLEIQRVRDDLREDLARLKASGAADDILVATCTKILERARDCLTRRQETETDFTAKRLEMTRKSLVTTYRQVHARLSRMDEEGPQALTAEPSPPEPQRGPR
jgi:hypothetical protein